MGAGLGRAIPQDRYGTIAQRRDRAISSSVRRKSEYTPPSPATSPALCCDSAASEGDLACGGFHKIACFDSGMVKRSGLLGVVQADRFVGRVRELKTLAALLDGGKGRTRSAFIEGEAGIGKTRLVGELLGYARQKGTRVLHGNCYQVDETGPYFPFLQILSELRLANPSSGTVLEDLAEAAPEQNDPNLLSDDVRGRRVQFLRALSDTILREAASSETLLCLEDLQWADIGSLLVVNNLLDVPEAGLAIVCTARLDESIDADLRQLLARIEQKSRRVLLRGLGLAEVREFVRSLTSPGEVSEEEVQALQTFTEGNPLFLQELLLHLRESGLLERHTLPEAITRSKTPRRLSHVIDLRLRSQPVSVRRTLAACSAIGMEFSAAHVAKVVGEKEVAVDDQLQASATKGILRAVDGLDASRYEFTHPLIQKRLYDALRPSERRDVHRKIAELATSGNVALTVDELARHYAAGFGPAGGRRAVGYCRAAAEQSERVLAYEMAARFWELALRCTRQRSRRVRAELYRRLGWSLWAASKWSQAAESWVDSVRLFESLEDWGRAGELSLALGDLHRFRQELEESERWLERALELLGHDSPERARALALLGGIHCVRGESSLGLKLLEEARQAVNDDGDPLVAYWLSFGLYTSGDIAGAYETAKKGLGEARQRGTSRALSLLAGNLVLYELNSLRLAPARTYARLVKSAVDPNDAATFVRWLVCQAWLLGYVGKWDRLAELCEEWMARVRLAGHYQVATAQVIWAESMLAAGDPLAAQQKLQDALPDMEMNRPGTALLLARAFLALGNIHEAGALVRQHSEGVASDPRLASGRLMLGNVACSLDEPELWRNCYDLLGHETRPLVILYTPLSVQRVRGGLATRLTLWTEAVEHFEAAVQQLREGGAVWELAQTYLDYARMRRERGRRGDTRKAAALELLADAVFGKLGIKHASLERPSPHSRDGNRFSLTGRELEVLALVSEGHRNPEIAETLTLSRGTVNRHLENIFVKMAVGSRTEAVVLALQEGLVGPVFNRIERGDGY